MQMASELSCKLLERKDATFAFSSHVSQVFTIKVRVNVGGSLLSLEWCLVFLFLGEVLFCVSDSTVLLNECSEPAHLVFEEGRVQKLLVSLVLNLLVGTDQSEVVYEVSELPPQCIL